MFIGNSSTQKRNISWMAQSFSILIPLMPLLDVYEINGVPVSFGEVFLIVFIIFSFFTLNNKIYIFSKLYLNFVLYAFILSLLLGILGDYFLFSDWIVKWIRTLIYTYTLLIMSGKYLNVRILSRGFIMVGVFISVVQIVQSLLWYGLHRMVILIIPYFKLHYVLSDYSEYYAHLMLFGGATWRPSNFFLEPADFCLYASISIICCLFISRTPKVKLSALITIAVLTSLSSFGIIMITVIWGYWIIKTQKVNGINKMFVVIVILIAFVVIAVCTSIIQSVLYRLGTTGESGSTTGSLRLLRGLSIFAQLPTIQKIFGVGLGDLANYLIQNNITTPYDTDLKPGNEYMNTLSYILVTTGYLGFSIFLSFVVSIYVKYRKYYIRIFIICWIIASASNANFLNIEYILPLLVMISILNGKKFEECV
ncbi:hypothetical protein [Limosilactobacillus reuteri]|uniref:hypothetical protein n=1 Tax=Limosilactobacillus reuteri TaxID=1598 RepID=UPI001E45D148|nr:hypothetical protein [Limosilactobacillus reuteri]MCC4372141.1 hypothetical protein [Limosilactobacillus reuteri]